MLISLVPASVGARIDHVSDGCTPGRNLGGAEHSQVVVEPETVLYAPLQATQGPLAHLQYSIYLFVS